MIKILTIFAVVWKINSTRAETATGQSPAAPARQTENWNARIVKSQKLALTTAYVDCDRGNSIAFGPGPASGQKKSVRSPECAPRDVKYSRNSPRMGLQGNIVDVAPAGGTDCSGYVSSVLCRAGARLAPGSDDCGPVSTERMIEWGSANDCFEVAEFTATEQLRPGCIMVWRNTETGYGHTVMIEKAGPDPFALGEGTPCDEEPKFANWDFSTTESLQSAGPSRWRGSSSRYAKSRLDKPGFILLYRLACKARRNGVAVPAEAHEGDWRAKVLCHAGSAKKGCTRPERRFKYESCVARCTDFN